MVISCKPSEYRVNDRIYNFLSIFFLNSPIAIFIFFFLNTYIKQSLCQKKKSILKFKHFAKYPRFAFGYLFFLSCRLQNARNAVSDNQIPPPPPTKRLAPSASFGPSTCWIASPRKKKPSYGPGDGKSEVHTE